MEFWGCETGCVLGGGTLQSFSEILLFFVWISRLLKSGFKDNYERSAGKCVHKWKKKKAKWMLKPFLKQNRNRAFDPLSRNNKTFAWSPRVWAFPCPSVCTCMSICPHTDTHGQIHTHFSLNPVSTPPPAPHTHGFHSFCFFLFFFLLLSIFWYFKAGSSGNGWNCHISVLAKEINANPITGSYHLSQNSQLKEKKNTLRCQSKKKKGLKRRGRPSFTFK